jgi:hypothetical protein
MMFVLVVLQSFSWFAGLGGGVRNVGSDAVFITKTATAQHIEATSFPVLEIGLFHETPRKLSFSTGLRFQSNRFTSEGNTPFLNGTQRRLSVPFLVGIMPSNKVRVQIGLDAAVFLMSENRYNIAQEDEKEIEKKMNRRGEVNLEAETSFEFIPRFWFYARFHSHINADKQNFTDPLQTTGFTAGLRWVFSGNK